MSNAVPEGWSVGTLSDFSDINPRLTQRSEMIADTPVSFIKMEDVSNSAVVKNVRAASYKQVSKGFTCFQDKDVLVAKITPCFENGKGGFVEGLKNGVGFGSTEFHVLRARKNSDPKFLYQFTNSQDFRIKGEANMTGSAGQRRVPTESLKTLDVVFPSLPEQQKIAAILSSVDDVIEKTRAQIDKLKDLKTGMMEELLAKGIGHTEFKDSPVGRIPSSWDVICLGDLGRWKGGGTPNKSNKDYWNGTIPWVSPKDMKSEFIYQTEDQISEEAVSESSTNMVESGSILIVVRSGILKHTLPVAMAARDLTLNQDMKALTVTKGFSAQYVYQYLLANNHRVLRATLKAGNTVESLDFSEFSKFLIPYPPTAEQHKIADAVESIARRIRMKSSQLSAYTILKKALMQDLLTGKVRVNVSDNESAVA